MNLNFTMVPATMSTLAPQNAVSLTSVLNKGWITDNEGKYLVGLILSIKVSQGKGKFRAYSSKNSQAVEASYDRILTIADLRNPDGQCFILLYRDHMQASMRMVVLRDKDIGVGQIIVIMEPTHGGSFISSSPNDLPILFCKRNLDLYSNYPIPTIPFLEHPPAGRTKYCCYKNISVLPFGITLENSPCTGEMCDRQIINRTHKENKCACFSKGIQSDIVIDCTMYLFKEGIQASPSAALEDDNLIITNGIDSFRSWIFTKLFFRTIPAATVTAQDFNVEKLTRFREKVRDCVYEVNSKTGWDVVCWYKKGISVDQAKQLSGTQFQDYDMVESDKLSPHICYLRPSHGSSISERNKYVFEEIVPEQQNHNNSTNMDTHNDNSVEEGKTEEELPYRKPSDTSNVARATTPFHNNNGVEVIPPSPKKQKGKHT